MDACGESQNDALVLKHLEKNYDCGTVYESDEIILVADIDPRESAVLSAAAAGHPPTGSDRLLLR